ncbi:c-type cytochrome [Desulfogranum japonicum]|uniref:c-type cytochrome n=1 Tax=Desulfogranum japonicum TaxID=231447 RepID=UPI000406E098|nr:cytochrome c [Desulfogranum japonicum]
MENQNDYLSQATDRSVSRLGIGLLGMFLLAGFCSWLIWSEPVRLELEQLHQHGKSISQGAFLYQEHCRTCHGNRGEGIGQLGPTLHSKAFFSNRLGEVGWTGTLAEYVRASIALGRITATRPMYAGDEQTAVMPPWQDRYGGILRMDQIEQLSAFILNWRASALGKVQLVELPMPEIRLNDPHVVAAGQKVFQYHCGACHLAGRDEQGSNEKLIGPDLQHIGQVAANRVSDVSGEEYIRESYLVPMAYTVSGYENIPAEKRCQGVLKESELRQIVAFLLSRR